MVLLHAFAVSALITFSNARPTIEQKVEPFTIRQIARRGVGNTTHEANGPLAYLKSLKKFKGDENVVSVIEASLVGAQASGAIPAIPPAGADVEYDSPVTIGGKTFKLSLDTGSSDLWVLGANTKATNHNLYTPGSTATAQNGQTWSIRYGDGSSASGVVYSDTVKIGNTAVQGMAVEVANTASTGFTNPSRTCDGLMGLGFDNINTVRPTRQVTFFTQAINRGLPKKVFTARLKKGAPGTYQFGNIDPNEYSGAITYAPVDPSRGWWTFTPSSYRIGNSAPVSPGSSLLTGIADTGTTLLLMDASIVTAYWKQVTGATYDSRYAAYTFPCANTPPNFTLVINGYSAIVPGSYMNYARISSTTCFGGMQSNSGIGFTIYGDIFLKSQFVVFDRSQSTPRIGFAIPK